MKKRGRPPGKKRQPDPRYHDAVLRLLNASRDLLRLFLDTAWQEHWAKEEWRNGLEPGRPE